MSEKIKDWLWAFKKNKKAQVILWIALGLILLLIIGYFVVTALITSDDSIIDNNATSNTNTNTATVDDLTSRRIDGVEVPISQSNTLPKAIVIENLRSVRPQSGLGSANLVYETLAEGGITRFLAIYASNDVVDPIGPVRSARHYFVDWAEEYGGLFAHVGGSPQALGILGTTDYMTDLNQFGYSQYYYRDDNLSAPHNLFTRSELIQFAARDLLNENAEGDYDPFLFKEPVEKKNRTETASPITIEFSSFDYSVEWQYDREENAYLRLNGGEPHVDALDGEQLSATNIVVQRAESSLLEEDTGRIDIITIGEGEALLFQDGLTYEGVWKKDERGDRTKFYDVDGNEFKFNPGTTWIEVVPTGSEINYA